MNKVLMKSWEEKRGNKKNLGSATESISTDVENLKNKISSAIPIFGVLEVEIEEENGRKVITFIDVDEADLFVLSKEAVVTDVNSDMSTTVVRLHVNEEGQVKVIEHNFHMFTLANKEQVLFLANLVGSKIVL